MEYSIRQVAEAAGTTSRALRHYDAVGLLPPSRIGTNGYRFYDDTSLIRLQRIMILRQQGLGLAAIGQVLAAQDLAPASQAQLLTDHLAVLREERRRISTQIASVERTIVALEAGTSHQKGTNLMAQHIFDGFDHSEHRAEVEQRWGREAYARSDTWWRGKSAEGRTRWQRDVAQLAQDWMTAAANGQEPSSPAAQELAARHADWLRSIPGTPAHDDPAQLGNYLLGLGEMYVTDERFAANYGGAAGATFVRDALRHYVETSLA